MKKRMFFTILGLVILFGGIFGYKWFVAQKTQEFFANREAPAETVTATEARADTWQPTVKSVGNLVAAQGVDITAEITGRVTSVAVEDGAEVEADQVLVELDSAGLQAELRGALAEARLSEIELERQQRLRRQNANSEADVDRAESELQQARAQADRVRSQLDKKTIEAPFAGRLGILDVDVGEFVNSGSPIVTLQTLDPINVDFTLPQQELARVEVGQPLVARADAFPGQRFEGRIRAISPKVNQRTRNVDVRGRLANPEGRLRPGMFVNVAVQLPAEEDVITLPQTAVTYNPYGDSIFVINESETEGGETELTVERKFIRTGATRGDQVQILEGVAVGDRVVTSGQLKLRNGSKVVVDNSVEPASDPSPELGNQ